MARLRGRLAGASGLLNMVRYATAGGIVALTYLVLTLLLSGPLSLPMWLAIAIGYVLSVTLHFFLQRGFVFSHVDEFALPVGAQVRRYLVVGVVQYSLTTSASEVLPGPLGVPAQVVYLGAVALLTVGSFLMLRRRVFHPSRA
jgi:putative flippase GtrA